MLINFKIYGDYWGNENNREGCLKINNEEKKANGMPQKCPHCKSTRLSKFTHIVEGITLKGWTCQKCRYKNARRFKENER